MNIRELYKIYKRCGGVVATDTRTLKGGELFFALKGENFDGNDYALAALEAGAAFAVVSEDSAVARSVAHSVARPVAHSESRFGTRSEGCSETRSEGCSETRSEGCSETRSEGCSETRSEGCTETRSKGCTGTHSEGCTETRSEALADSALLTDDGLCRIIPVADTLKTLQELARWHRSVTFVDGKPLNVIALTGTNGKTTTKELIRSVLSVKYNVCATEGNLNNNIGVPLTLLKINEDTQIAVVEMGASHPGDIKELVEIALPDFGLVTNVGKAHLLGFGSFEGVMKTKGELYDYLRRTADKVFINADNPYLCKMASDRNLQSDPERPYSLLVPYGVEYQNVSILPSSSEHPFLRMVIPAEDGATIQVDTRLIGSYNADNVMAAIAVGKYFGVSAEDAAAAVSAYVPSNNRSQMTKTDRNLLIVDAYNANPTSMEAAISNFASVESGSKVVLLGDMLELGADSLKEHIAVIERVLPLGFSKVCLVGSEFSKAVSTMAGNGTAFPESLKTFSDSGELAASLRAEPVSGSVVLVKGSRGIRMEKALEVL